MLDYGIVVREFEVQSRYYAQFPTNSFGKGMNPFIQCPVSANNWLTASSAPQKTNHSCVTISRINPKSFHGWPFCCDFAAENLVHWWWGISCYIRRPIISLTMRSRCEFDPKKCRKWCKLSNSYGTVNHFMYINDIKSYFKGKKRDLDPSINRIISHNSCMLIDIDT